MTRSPALSGLGLWLAVVMAFTGQAPAAESKDATAPEAAKPVHVVVIQDKAPVLFEDHQIGELAEGERVQVLESREGWSRVRATFRGNWFEGWMRTAMTAPDSLADVGIKIKETRPTDTYKDPDTGRDLIVPGQQFLELKVKLEPTEKAPPRVYFSFHDQKTADLYLTFDRGSKALPYAFVRRVPGVTRPVFERDEKRQVLLLTPGEALIETYVFLVPVRSRDFDLVLKDTVTRVPIRR